MMIYLGALVLATYISASTALPPCVCTRDLKPVCGTDGTTYNNECLLDCARTRGKSELAVERRGRCDFPGIQDDNNSCICTLEHKPVCGSDGQTYPNSCAMGCQARARGVEIVKTHDGECRQKREITLPDYACMCTMELMPLCGSDGKSYPNQCAMECQARGSKVDIVKVYDGECGKRRDSPNDCICTMDYRPVCASDGNTYPNRCAMNCHARAKSVHLENVHDGECTPKRDTVKVAQLDPCVCTKEKKPVCGTDGHTYSNSCLLRCTKQVKPDLEIQHGGSCETVERVEDIPTKHDPCTCNRNLDPVCSTSGETFSNECRLQCAGAQLANQGPCDGVIQQVVVEENSS